MTAQASGRQGRLAPACQLGNRSLFWATNRLTHGFLQRYQIFPQPFSIPSSGSALGRYCKRLRVYPVSLQSPWVNLYIMCRSRGMSICYANDCKCSRAEVMKAHGNIAENRKQRVWRAKRRRLEQCNGLAAASVCSHLLCAYLWPA